MPNTLSELGFAYSIVWILICFLILKIKSDVTKLEHKVSKLGAKNADKS